MVKVNKKSVIQHSSFLSFDRFLLLSPKELLISYPQSTIGILKCMCIDRIWHIVYLDQTKENNDCWLNTNQQQLQDLIQETNYHYLSFSQLQYLLIQWIILNRRAFSNVSCISIASITGGIGSQFIIRYISKTDEVYPILFYYSIATE